MALNIIFIGNPGNGKSTLLDILCNGNYFAGGYFLRTGSMAVFDKCTLGDITYIDTPGLNDVKYENKETAYKELSKALKGGVNCKVFFVVGETAGRVNQEDVATMNMVMDAVPEITANNFAVIVNKCADFTMNLPETGDGSTKTLFKTLMFSRWPGKSTVHVLFLPVIADIVDKPSASMDFAKVREHDQIKKILKFTYDSPIINLT